MGSLDMPMRGVPLKSAILYMMSEFWKAMAHQACWGPMYFISYMLPYPPNNNTSI